MIDTNFVYILQNEKFFEYTHTFDNEELILENYNCDILFDLYNNIFKILRSKEILNKPRYKFISTKQLKEDFKNQLRIK